ncbi:MAG: hypothetical protein ACP5JG_00190 [Anaerolineae bacterium]
MVVDWGGMMRFLETSDFRWARRVRKDDIYNLYLSDAADTLDETLVAEVGIGFYARCRTISMVMVT